MAKRDSAGEIRRSQYIYTYGPGSVINMKIDPVTMSFIMGDLRSWEFRSTALKRKDEQILTDERIIKELKDNFSGFNKITHFRMPPVDPEEEDTSYLAASIFPSWLLCPQCRNLYNINDPKQSRDCLREDRSIRRFCNNCSSQKKKVYVVPSRFVTACKKGHIDNFDYKWWLNTYGEGVDKECPHYGMKLLQPDGSLSITNLIIQCSDCKGKAHLGEIFSKDFKCRGARPWKTFEKFAEYEECGERSKAYQRNQRSLWQRINISALEIPPLDYQFPKKIGPDNYRIIADASEDKRALLVETLFERISELWKINSGSELLYSQDELLDVINSEIKKQGELTSDIFYDEFQVLTSDNIELIKEFKKVSHSPPPEFRNINSIAEIQKLKVVDALLGFTRVGGDPIYFNENTFLPAVAIFGEGFFIDFNLKFINNYLEKPNVKEGFKKFSDDITPNEKRKIILHSVSHAILKAAARHAGYSITSIKERLYVNEKMAGILFYTSSSDCEGTLGGLSRLAEQKRINEIFDEAEKITRICSNDPLCHEGLYSEQNENNGSICHSCLILPETSCDFQNEFLDRSLIEDFWEELKK